MPIPILEGFKKRKLTTKVFSFHTFAHRGCPISPSGPFRHNIRDFLRECADPKGYDVDGMPVWCTFLAHQKGGVLVPLYTIEESVKISASPLCNQCRVAGWNNHFVSKRKYHIIIPIDNEWNKQLEDGIFDQQTHLLHGVIHCNGFGHLLSINGIEGGSKYLSGRQIMDLWDRICTILRTRKITVEDASKKHSMDLRLLHGVAYGHPWFGRWNYKFLHGSFGVTEHKYDMALDFLSSLQIQNILDDFSTTDQYKEINQIIGYYKNKSETDLITLRDILKFMLKTKSHVVVPQKKQPIVIPSKPKTSKNNEKSGKCRNFLSVAACDSRWPVRRLEYTANVIVEALKEKRFMTRQEARDAARLHIGDTGLIDYVLKSMKNVIVGNFIVSRIVNPATRVLEFSLKDLENNAEKDNLEKEIDKSTVPSPPSVVAGSNVNEEVAFLYHNVILSYPESESGFLVNLAAQAVLNSKVFVKEWPFIDDYDDLLRFFCRVRPSFLDDFEAVLDNKFRVPPGELIVVPLYATIRELITEAESALRDTYFATENVLITEIEGKEGMGDDEMVFGSGLESGSGIWMSGAGMELGGEVAYEGGAEEWTVRCVCGAGEDDGERMVACDICEVWQHTKCGGIGDSEAVPPLFVCGECCTEVMPPKICVYESLDSSLWFDGLPRETLFFV